MQGLIGTGSGLSKTRLTQMHDVMARHVENGSMPGLVALVGRHGEVQVDAIGNMAVGGAPMQPGEFGKFIADETEKWRKVVEFAGVSVGCALSL